VASWRNRVEDLMLSVARAEAVRLAKRIYAVNGELINNIPQIKKLIERSEAAFAALAGVSPVPDSSGNATRHRLNRGGARRLNRALHMATVTRIAQTRDTCLRRQTTSTRAQKKFDVARRATSPAESTERSKCSTRIQAAMFVA